MSAAFDSVETVDEAEREEVLGVGGSVVSRTCFLWSRYRVRGAAEGSREY